MTEEHEKEMDQMIEKYQKLQTELEQSKNIENLETKMSEIEGVIEEKDNELLRIDEEYQTLAVENQQLSNDLDEAIENCSYSQKMFEDLESRNNNTEKLLLETENELGEKVQRFETELQSFGPLK